MRVVHTVKSQLRGEKFHKNDLEKEEVSVYRAKDGKQLFSTEVKDVDVAEQSFALSPSGDQLAVLSEHSIALFQVKMK